MAFLALENSRSAGRILASATAPAAQLIEKLGREDAALLMNFQAAEQTRLYLYNWETAEIMVALALGACLFLGTHKRALPLALCGFMLLCVLFEHLRLSPELSARGRAASAGLWAIEQFYGGVEGVKLILGGVLASYLFVFRSGRRVQKKVDTVDHPDHSHVDG